MRVDTVFDPIRTDRLVLRRSVPEDAETIAAYRSDPDVNRQQGWERTDVDSVRGDIVEMSRRSPGEPGGWVQFTVLDRDGRIVGDVGLSLAEPDTDVIKVGYTIAPEFQGAGYATEAIAALVDYAFDTLGAEAMHLIEKREYRDGDEVWYGVRYEIRRDER
jgi:RimJ/RimL family protein N-acetyltransferase